MYPDQTTTNSWFTPKTLIIGGAVVLLLTLGGNLAYNAYIQYQFDTEEQINAQDDIPTGESVPVEQDTFTFSPDDQKYAIDYPKEITLRELQKTYYKNSKRLFEGRTEFITNKNTNDPQYFKMTIISQRSYKDELDKDEMLLNVLTGQRFCNATEYKKTRETGRAINDINYAIRQDLRNCGGAPYTTFYEGFTRVGTYVIEIKSNQPFDRIRSGVDELLITLYLDSD